jgi:hypothetical protein
MRDDQQDDEAVAVRGAEDVMLAALLTFSLAITDARQTCSPGRELNPIMRPVAGSCAASVATKLGSATLTTWSVRTLHKQKRTKTAWALWIGVNVAQGAVVWHNARVK